MSWLEKVGRETWSHSDNGISFTYSGNSLLTLAKAGNMVLKRMTRPKIPIIAAQIAI
jgi:hypothetical protein